MRAGIGDVRRFYLPVAGLSERLAGRQLHFAILPVLIAGERGTVKELVVYGSPVFPHRCTLRVTVRPNARASTTGDRASTNVDTLASESKRYQTQGFWCSSAQELNPDVNAR